MVDEKAADAGTSQRLEQQSLRLVEALTRIVEPLDRILELHEESQKKMRLAVRLLVAEAALGLVLIVGVAFNLYSDRQLRSMIIDLQGRIQSARQDVKDDVQEVGKKLDETPKLTVKRSSPSAEPTFMIEAPAPPQSSVSSRPIQIPMPVTPAPSSSGKPL